MERAHILPMRTSAWGPALVAGLATGFAAGFFLQSDTGRELTSDARRRIRKMRRELQHRMRDIKNLTRDKYEDMVEDVIDSFTQSKDLATTQLNELKRHLLADWEDIRHQFSTDRARPPRPTVPTQIP